MQRFWEKVYKGPDCWVWTAGRFPNGYGKFRLGAQQGAHRVSWELAHGPIPSGLFVCHTCDNRQCVNPAHLFLGTHQENVDDCVAKVRHGVGDANGRVVLPDAVLPKVRMLYARGHTQSALARRFGVSRATIGRVVRGERKELTRPRTL